MCPVVFVCWVSWEHMGRNGSEAFLACGLVQEEALQGEGGVWYARAAINYHEVHGFQSLNSLCSQF